MNYSLKCAIEQSHSLYVSIANELSEAETNISSLVSKIDEMNDTIINLNNHLAEDASPGETLNSREISSFSKTSLKELKDRFTPNLVDLDGISNDGLESKFNDILENFEEGMLFTKKMAKEYNLPDDELLEKHKKHFLEEMSQKTLNLDCYVLAYTQLGIKLSDISKKIDAYPEITSLFIEEALSEYFSEHMISDCEKNEELFSKTANVLYFTGESKSASRLKLNENIQNRLLTNDSFKLFNVLFHEKILKSSNQFMTNCNQAVAESLTTNKEADKLYIQAIKTRTDTLTQTQLHKISEINKFFINNKIDLSEEVAVIRETIKLRNSNVTMNVPNDEELNSLRLAKIIESSLNKDNNQKNENIDFDRNLGSDSVFKM